MATLRYRISHHAFNEMARRGITEEMVADIMLKPQQVVPERGRLVAHQTLVRFDDGRPYLVRIIVNSQVDPAVVVTVYRTSKVGKYWRIP